MSLNVIAAQVKYQKRQKKKRKERKRLSFEAWYSPYEKKTRK